MEKVEDVTGDVSVPPTGVTTIDVLAEEHRNAHGGMAIIVTTRTKRMEDIGVITKDALNLHKHL